MAWPLALGAIGGALIGGMFQKDANDENRAGQEAFAQHGIRWKVADAKAAGLHPLFALGGSGAAYSPSAQPVMTAAEGARMGQDVARALMPPSQAESLAVDLARSQIQRTDMETLEIASRIKRQEAAQVGAAPVATSHPVVMPGAPTGRNLGEINPDGSWMVPPPRELGPLNHPPAYMSTNEPKPALRPWSVAGVPGGQVLLPDAQNFAEALESLENTANQAFILHQNAVHYGPIAARAIRDFLLREHRAGLRRFQGR